MYADVLGAGVRWSSSRCRKEFSNVSDGDVWTQSSYLEPGNETRVGFMLFTPSTIKYYHMWIIRQFHEKKRL